MSEISANDEVEALRNTEGPQPNHET